MEWLLEVNVSEKHAASIFRAEDEDGTIPHGDLTQKNIIRITTVLGTWSLTEWFRTSSYL
jgi:hypothetical protein